MFFYIADPHFGHENAIGLCARPFASVREMDETLIRNWNSRVTGGDTVWVLGDLFFRCAEPEPVLERLRGKKRLLVGNHDGSWMQRVDCGKYFVSVDELVQITDRGRTLVLCHYPLLTWKHQARSYMVHGHVHANTDMDFWPCMRARENLLNAGVEINGFAPVPFEELLENNRLFKQAH